jgi:tRNA 2-thiouridine synthesizing protein A
MLTSVPDAASPVWVHESLAFDLEIDARGLSCPWPAIHLRRALDRDLRPGGIVRLLAREGAAVKDISAFCARTGHTLIAYECRGVESEIFVRKRS